MTEKEINMYSELIGERYGEVVKAVATYLLKQLVPQPVAIIGRHLGMPLKDVRPALAVLLCQDIAQCSIGPRGIAQYIVRCDKVYPLLIHPHCIVYVKDRLGSNAELLLEEIFFQPGITMSLAIKKVAEKLHDASDDEITLEKICEVQEAFTKLARNKLIHRCCDVTMVEEDKTPISQHQLFLIPEINLQFLEKLVNSTDDLAEPQMPPAKKVKLHTEEFPDKEIFWMVNIERFEIHLRNEAILHAAASVVDEKAASIVRAIIERGELAPFADNKTWTPTSPPVTYYEILHHLKGIEGKELEFYLSVMSDGEFCFISKVDDRSGGTYVVNTSKIVSKLAETAAADVVKETFGSKYSRIFRLLIKEKYLEHKQIGDYCMIPSKDVENYIYELMEHSYVTTKAIAKTPDYAPKKTIYLFHVDLIAVCRMLLQTCFHSLYNALSFFEMYRKNNSRLVDKKMRLDAIIATLEQSGAEQQQIEEVAQVITPVEKEMLDEVNKSCSKLHMGICQLTDMVILLKSFLRLASCK